LRQIRQDGEHHDWALEFDQLVADKLEKGDHNSLKRLQSQNSLFRLAHPTSEHFAPTIYVAAVAQKDDQLSFFNDQIDMGSLSMRSFVYF